ncbi:MAG: 2-amino-4-hydroxy-6-hydroxymethyldihydropteridine diphosphokinase [Coriobacteriia bacterium]|nr:2-amino-4-hydroxy-6-hydroxymethyldihydropteridine diphosphokinase [Coriobacteriia bacterium]
MRTVHVALGSNLGDRLVNLAAALVRIEELPETVLLGASHVYESEPWGAPGQPLYANAVAVIDTPLEVPELLDALKEIERGLGREPGPPNSPRVIDLDVLLAQDEEWVSEDLVVPHPRIAERDFVVTPLLEIDPGVRFPDGRPVTREAVRVGRVLGVLGAVPGFEERTAVATPSSMAAEVTARPVRSPLPAEEWAPVCEYGSDPSPFGSGTVPVGIQLSATPSGQRPLQGRNPEPAAGFAALLLEQEGIPFAWDPFPPDQASDPYGFQRRFRLMVPASMAQEARRLIEEASSAPIDWASVHEMTGDAEGETPDDVEGKTPDEVEDETPDDA